MISNRWKILAAALPIIGTLALAQPQPGGLGGFFSAWYGAASFVQAPTDYLHFWNFSANLSANDDAGNMNGSTFGGSYTTNGFVQASNQISYVTFGGPITNSTTAYTLSMWAKPDTLAMANNTFGGWLLNDRGSSTGLDFQLSYRVSDNAWRWASWNAAGTATAVGYTNVQDGVWYHLVCIADGNSSEILLYVDGVLADSAAFSGTLANASTIAARTGNAAWTTPASDFQFEGIQDKIRFYNRRLNQAEITAIYNFEKEEKGIP